MPAPTQIGVAPPHAVPVETEPSALHWFEVLALQVVAFGVQTCATHVAVLALQYCVAVHATFTVEDRPFAAHVRTLPLWQKSALGVHTCSAHAPPSHVLLAPHALPPPR